MALPGAKQLRIKEALASKIAHMPKCELCACPDWEVSLDGWIVLPIQDTPGETVFGGAAYGVLPIFCHNCGNTKLMNMSGLGLADIATAT